MNVRVHRTVSDIDGVTGMAIMRAIVMRFQLLRQWPGSEPLPHREAVRIACHLGSEQTDERRQSGEEEETGNS